jgi:nucleotide-binding universal stress UspA family protein
MRDAKIKGESDIRMAQVFKKILCPLDFDACSAAALKVAADLASQNHAHLHAMHVINVPGSSLGFPAERYDRLARIEHERLKDVLRAQVPNHLSWEASVKVGNPAEEIINAAEELDVDLIVMATHGRAGVPRLVLGSVAEYVIRGSDRPVLAVKPPTSAKEERSRKTSDR